MKRCGTAIARSAICISISMKEYSLLEDMLVENYLIALVTCLSSACRFLLPVVLDFFFLLLLLFFLQQAIIIFFLLFLLVF
jgi:hypothetical protein